MVWPNQQNVMILYGFILVLFIIYLILKTFFWHCLVVYVGQNIFKSVLTEFNNNNIINFFSQCKIYAILFCVIVIQNLEFYTFYNCRVFVNKI